MMFVWPFSVSIFAFVIVKSNRLNEKKRSRIQNIWMDRTKSIQLFFFWSFEEDKNPCDSDCRNERKQICFVLHQRKSILITQPTQSLNFVLFWCNTFFCIHILLNAIRSCRVETLGRLTHEILDYYA